jgi:apolipoprotein D and lipocalin family protein
MRRRWFGLAVAGAAVGVVVARALAESKESDLKTVGHVDLGRYAGRWYEVARLPLYWENKCAGDVTATYTLAPDGMVGVLNECRKADGSMTASKGTARVAVKDGSNSRLKVTFLWPGFPFGWGDYWILDLDPEYRWALVGTPNRKYLWVLSRASSLEQDVLDRLVEEARGLGFDVSKLIHTRQSGAEGR